MIRVYAIIGASLALVFVLGFAGAIETRGDWAGTLGSAVCLGAVVMAGRMSQRSTAALLGAVVGGLAAFAYLEGRYVAYLTGWNGLEMDHFLSATGDGFSDGAQGIVVLLSLALGVPLSLVGAAVGWLVGRRQAAEPASHAA